MEINTSVIINSDDPILITGATGFIGPYLVESLLRHGFRNLRAFARPSSDVTKLELTAASHRKNAHIEIIRGNLLSQDDCLKATEGVAVIFHLASSGDKSFSNAYMNSVLTTRNLLESSLQHKSLKRFVNVSSFAVYANRQTSGHRLLNESSPVENHVQLWDDAYRFAKVKQDEIVTEYGKKFAIPYVIVRPGSVFGHGKEAISGRVGIDTFGIFLHMGGGNRVPFTYVENCADAIVLAGSKKGIEGEIFNVVDDNLPSSRQFLRLYKKNIRSFSSIYIPHALSYSFCWLWEKYSKWSEGQLPPTFNRRRWHTEWKKTYYDNNKLKSQLGWMPNVSMTEALTRYFQRGRNA